MLSINMLGQVNISYDGENIADRFSTKLMALICLLVLNCDREISRERLSAYLWPDSDEEAAKYNLRYNLWAVKKLIPPDCNGQGFISIKKGSCRINKQYQFQCDRLYIDSFDKQKNMTTEELIRLKELFKGDFLEGFYLKNCNEFNEMILFERVVCQNRQVEIMKKLADACESANQNAEALQILQEMMIIEPYSEDFVYRILNIYKKIGNRAAGINYYKNFEAKLRSELNIAPNKELKFLYRTITEESFYEEEHVEHSRRQKKDLTIETRCMKKIDYFWMGEVIEALLRKGDKNYLLELNPCYILDLSYIQNELLLYYEKLVSKEHSEIGKVPDVRIVNGFMKFMKHASDVYRIHIYIDNYSEMDSVSLAVLEKIKNSEWSNISIIKGK